MMIETHSKVIERKYSIAACILIDNLPGKQFYVYIENLTAKSTNWPNL